jgi:hypothetical protein
MAALLLTTLQDDKGLKPEQHLYELPFPAGKTIRVLAGNGEGSTHQGDFFYSWDFLIPVGDIVCATRGGTVSQIFDSRTDRRGMGILINHGDGTHALYGHLMRGGILVKKGEKVETGEPIAKVGPESGCPTPHLHYHVTTDERLSKKNSAPVLTNFKGPGGQAWRPRQGESCTSENKEPANLSDLRRARRTLPLLQAAVSLKAGDFVREAMRHVSGIDAALLKNYPKVDALEADLLKDLTYAKAVFAVNECKNSPHLKEFEARLEQLKAKVTPDQEKAVREQLNARKAFIQALKNDLRDSWDSAREPYEKASKSSDPAVARLAKELRDAITPAVR